MLLEEAIVFVVEDDEAIRKAMHWLFQTVNLKVEAFTNAQAYLQRHNPKQLGCLLIDIRMPGIGGFELLEELNRRHNTIPVIFITGHGDVPMAVRALQEGAVDFILKPFNDQILLEKVQKAILQQKNNIQEKTCALDMQSFDILTSREKEVANYIVAGKLNKQIAAELKIAQSTVEFHRANLMQKLNAKSVAELIKICLFQQQS